MSWEPWTKEETQFVKENYEKLGPIEISRILGRSKHSTGWKAHFLGLYKLTPKDIITKDKLVELYCNRELSSNEIAELTGLKSILYLLNKYGIPRRKSIESLHLRQKRKPPKTGKDLSYWRGGRAGKPGDYQYVSILPDNLFYYSMGKPNSGKYSKRRYVQEHRLVMAQHLGRPLRKHEIVHHLNGIKDDNRIENLQLVDKQSIHVSTGKRVAELEKEIRLLKVQVKILTERLNQLNVAVPELEGTWLDEEGNLRW